MTAFWVGFAVAGFGCAVVYAIFVLNSLWGIEGQLKRSNEREDRRDKEANYGKDAKQIGGKR